MKEKLEWLQNYADAHDFGDWFSIGAGIAMGLINTVAMMHGESRLFAALLSFYFGFSLMRIVLLILRKTNHTRACAMDLATAGFLFLTMPTFNIALFILADGKSLIDFPFDFMIYGYAFYAFYKVISSAISIHRGKKEQSAYLQCISVLSMLSAAYTMLSLMVNLVYRQGQSEELLFQRIELALLIATMAYSFVMMIVLSVRGFRDLRKYRAMKRRRSNEIATRQ